MRDYSRNWFVLVAISCIVIRWGLIDIIAKKVNQFIYWSNGRIGQSALYGVKLDYPNFRHYISFFWKFNIFYETPFYWKLLKIDKLRAKDIRKSPHFTSMRIPVPPTPPEISVVLLHTERIVQSFFWTNVFWVQLQSFVVLWHLSRFEW